MSGLILKQKVSVGFHPAIQKKQDMPMELCQKWHGQLRLSSLYVPPCIPAKASLASFPKFQRANVSLVISLFLLQPKIYYVLRIRFPPQNMASFWGGLLNTPRKYRFFDPSNWRLWGRFWGKSLLKRPLKKKGDFRPVSFPGCFVYIWAEMVVPPNHPF